MKKERAAHTSIHQTQHISIKILIRFIYVCLKPCALKLNKFGAPHNSLLYIQVFCLFISFKFVFFPLAWINERKRS